MSLLLPDSGLLFWMFLSFGIVFVILAKYGFPVIIKMVEGRKTYIDQSLEVAREANAQLSKLKEEGDALVAAANKEQGRILREAMEERDKIVHEARKQAEIAAQKELDAVKQQIQMEKDKQSATSVARWPCFLLTSPRKCSARVLRTRMHRWA